MAHLEALAAHKRGYRSQASPKREYKVELWLLFPTQGIVRTLALDAEKVRPEDEARATYAGDKIMADIYSKRAKQIPQMRQEARDRLAKRH